MQFSTPFTFLFADSDWLKKIIIISLVGLIPIIGWLVVLGWSLEITRRVILDDPMPVPNMNFGADLGRGFKAFVIDMVYALPFILAGIIFTLILTGVLDNRSNAATIIVILLSVCMGIFGLLYSLLMAFMLPAALGHFAATDKMSAAFKLGEVFGKVKKALIPYLLVVVGAFIAGLIAPLGGVFFAIGSALTNSYAQAIIGHFTAQAYKQASQ